MVTLERFVINKFKIMVHIKTALFFFCLIVSQMSCAQSQFNVKFDSEISLRKFIVTEMPDKDIDSFIEKPPYAASATFNIMVDLKGYILKIDFVKESEDKRFNEVYKDLIMKTSGLWKVINPKPSVSTVNIITTVIQRSPPNNRELENPELIKRFEDYHKSLTVGSIPNCKLGSCVVLEVIGNSMRTRGVK